MRVDAVGDPACQRKASGGDGFGREQRVVDAAEAHADYQYHWQAEFDGQIGRAALVAKRHTESANTFDDDEIGLFPSRLATRRDGSEVDADTGFGRRDVRRDGGFKAIGVDDLAGKFNIAGGRWTSRR